ncbi:MAG: transporter substrate-binding domain-containing protein [Clostridiales bacterium]|nr:transporter substrate-binding domain-containing protein [Clostridiales bacterium]
MKLKHLTVLMLVLLTLLSLVSCQTPASGATATPASGATTAPDDSSAPDEDDWSYIKAKGNLIIGYTLYEPMNYMDGETLTGFDTEFAQAVCDKLGLEPVFTVIVWDTKEVELEAKTIDCIWNGMTIDEERSQNMNISQPYVKNMQVVIIRKENADLYTDTASLAGKTIAAEAGSAGEKVVNENTDLSQGTLVPVLQQTDALLEVKAGTSDAAVLDYVLAKAMVGEGTDYADLQIVDGLELAVEEYGIGFRKNSTATEKVNAVIDELIADGTLQALADKYDVNLAD